MKGCPKCGSKQGYAVRDYFSGWAEFLGDWEGRREESLTFNDDVTVKQISKTVVCLDCGKRSVRPFKRG